MSKPKSGKENGFRIFRGSGGDEYFVVAKRKTGDVSSSFKKSVSEYNLFGLIKEGEDGKRIPGLPTEDESNLRPREVFFTFPDTLSQDQVKALESWDATIELGRREGGLILSVDREISDLSIAEIKTRIKQLADLVDDAPVNEVSWDAPNGVAVFTTSMGSLSVLDVIAFLSLAQIEHGFENKLIQMAV